MSLSRRHFLKLGTMASAAGAATACRVVGREMVQGDLPETVAIPTPAGAQPTTQPGPELPTRPVDPVWRLLNRAGYGPRPGDVERVQEMGFETYLERQLAPESIEDTAAELYVRGLTTSGMDISQLIEMERADVIYDLMAGTFVRALVSHRQLYEALVEFWTDHFNIYLLKNQAMPALKLIDDREVIRPHALGTFRQLLGASARSPAMLGYLDNVRNVKGVPNENYARELLELHSLGVDGGYTQQDVMEAARALTGFGVRRRGPRGGQFHFDADQHDDGEKVVLGQRIPAGRGAGDLDALLDIVAGHPSTARFIAGKLVRRFVADVPPPALVERVAGVFTSSGGDIRALLRTIFLSEEFAAGPVKLKRPFTYMISALRALHADLARPSRQIAQWLGQMGQPLFQWPPPDGYPDVATAWAGNLLPRWNFALALTGGQIRGVRIPLAELIRAGRASDSRRVLETLTAVIHGRAMTDQERALFADYVGNGALNDRQTRQALREAAALQLCSPDFQWT